MPFMWKIDYPLTILVIYLAFLIPLNKKKRFWIWLIAGIALLFGWWQIQNIGDFMTNNVALMMLMYIVEIAILFGLCFFTLEGGVSSSFFIMLSIVSLQHLSYKVSLQIINFININRVKSGVIECRILRVLSNIFK